MNEALTEKLQAALSRHLGRAVGVRDVARLTGGATKHTYAFTLVEAGAARKLIMRRSGATQPTRRDGKVTPRLDGESDATLTMAAAARGVQVPKVVAVL